MNAKSLEKWRDLNLILEDYMFEISHTIDDYQHNYYYNDFDGRIEYDIEGDYVTFFNNKNERLIHLHGDELNGLTLSQYLIQFVGK